jgi:hypothetical protein
MLGILGVVIAENSTGISWADAGKVLDEQPSYLGFDINVPLSTLVGIEVLAMGFAEVKRSSGTSFRAARRKTYNETRDASLTRSDVFFVCFLSPSRYDARRACATHPRRESWELTLASPPPSPLPPPPNRARLRQALLPRRLLRPPRCV